MERDNGAGTIPDRTLTDTVTIRTQTTHLKLERFFWQVARWQKKEEKKEKNEEKGNKQAQAE